MEFNRFKLLRDMVLEAEKQGKNEAADLVKSLICSDVKKDAEKQRVHSEDEHGE